MQLLLEIKNFFLFLRQLSTNVFSFNGQLMNSLLLQLELLFALLFCYNEFFVEVEYLLLLHQQLSHKILLLSFVNFGLNLNLVVVLALCSLLFRFKQHGSETAH